MNAAQPDPRMSSVRSSIVHNSCNYNILQSARKIQVQVLNSQNVLKRVRVFCLNKNTDKQNLIGLMLQSQG